MWSESVADDKVRGSQTDSFTVTLSRLHAQSHSNKLQVLDNFNEILAVLLANSIEIFIYVLLCSLAVLDPRIGHTMDVLSPFISVLCHSDWLFHGECCPRLNVRTGHIWEIPISGTNNYFDHVYPQTHKKLRCCKKVVRQWWCSSAHSCLRDHGML